ncbi:50S ribosomal protein L11 methyltransferase [Hellea balneolensis]|uniref:50S ribosomal protein L11 methyltransferase n=1 Tax=Hellea balneolensis TaxID=287478 RepID=UPI0004021A60|nr:50S ribosomal protein L11 methyltransferase [Hellea balneolensis]
MIDHPPFALFIRGSKVDAFAVSDQLGFETGMEALAVSLFEDGPETMHVQALFETQAQAEACLDGLKFPSDMESFITQLPDEDWISKSQAGLPPVKAGRFWLYGTHDADNIPSNVPFPIEINAGLAFGTGHHGTTKGCLLIFDKLLESGFKPKRVLDLGCGAGVLAIAAAKALQQDILATDIDQDAVDVTLQNALANNVSEFVKSYQADGFDSPELKGQRFDLIFANILAKPLMGLAPDIAHALAPDGKVILSGILNEQAEMVSDAFTKKGLEVSPQPSLSGWTSLLGQKP